MPPPGWVPTIVQGPNGPYAECPDCGTKVPTGLGGTGNLTKQHMGKGTCKTAKLKREKEALKEKQKQDMKKWLSGQASKSSKLVPSTVSEPQETTHLASTSSSHPTPTPACSTDSTADMQERVSVALETPSAARPHSPHPLPATTPLEPQPRASRRASISGSRSPVVDEPIPQESLHLMSFEYEDTIQNTQSLTGNVPCCNGYALVIPNTSSSVKSYPFPIHDPELFPKQHLVPWEARTRNGLVYVTSKNCAEFATPGNTSCAPCCQLKQHRTLQGILDRMENGTHENTSYIWHGFESMRARLDRKNEQIQFHRLRSLNQAKTILRKAAAVTEHKRVLMAISSGKVQRVDRVISLALKQKKGVRGIWASLHAASEGLYCAKSFTEREARHAVLIWRLGGNRVAEINHRSQNAPGLTYLRKISKIPPLVSSPGVPTVEEIKTNARATVGGLLDILKEKFGDTPIRHAVMMYDELKTESRIRYDMLSNHFLGVCREHAHHVCLKFVNEGDMKALFRAIDDEKVHCAGEATIAALGIISNDTRIYASRPILISGDCKRESGWEHRQNVIDPTLNAMEDLKTETNIRITSIASDGESRRGAAFITKTFCQILSEESPIYPLVSPLKFVDQHCGEDDLTCDKDWKHVFKRFRNLLLRPKGIVVNGVRITPDITRDHLRESKVSADHIRAIFTPNDKQDVKLAFDLLQAIWSLPEAPAGKSPGFLAAREALRLLGRFLYHTVFPYLCVDLSLSEQLEHLSTAAHLAFALYLKDGNQFMPANLFIDFNLMIKNILWCIAKAKIDIPGSDFHIILLGTDRLETLFGILRTMVGNDANLDILQLACRLASTTEVSNILAEFPEWDRGPRRLKLPVLSRESKELHDRVDHIMPASWKGDVNVDHVSLQTCWNEGRRNVEESYPFAKDLFDKIDGKYGYSMLAPTGALLFDIPDHEPDDTLDVSEGVTDAATDAATDQAEASDASHLRVDVEDALLEEVHGQVLIDGTNVSKARVLSRYSKYRLSFTPNSTDRLRRVQGVSRYMKSTSGGGEEEFNIHDMDESNSASPTETETLSISDPIASLLSCESKTWLCIGEVNGLRIDGKPVEFINFDMLDEETVSVTYQLLGLCRTSLDEDPTEANDWRTYRLRDERTFTTPGSLVASINPDISTTHDTELPWYLLESQFLVSLAESLSQAATLSESTVKKIPKIAVGKGFPYLENNGDACFLCENSSDITDRMETHCPKCVPSVVLDVQSKNMAQKVLEHMASHILTDHALASSAPICGLCLQPPPLCQYYLKKGKGSKANLKVDNVRTKGCGLKVDFTYGTAMKYTKFSPCTNVPIICPICPASDPAIWRYFLRRHMYTKHGKKLAEEHRDLWYVSQVEINAVKAKYANRTSLGVPKVRKVPALKVSAAHRSRIPERTQATSQTLSNHSEPEAESSDAEESDAEVPDDLLDGEDASDTGNSTDSTLPESAIAGVVACRVGARNDAEGDIPPSKALVGNVGAAGSSRVAAEMESESVKGADGQIVGEGSRISCREDELASDIPTPTPVASDSSAAIELSPVATTTGRPKRRRPANKQVSQECEVCEHDIVEGNPNVIECVRKGCETRWYHIICEGLDQEPRNWVCGSCKATKRSRN